MHLLQGSCVLLGSNAAVSAAQDATHPPGYTFKQQHYMCCFSEYTPLHMRQQNTKKCVYLLLGLYHPENEAMMPNLGAMKHCWHLFTKVPKAACSITA